MILSVLFFSLMDVLIKVTYEYDVGQVMFSRALFGLIPIFFLIPKEKLKDFYKTKYEAKKGSNSLNDIIVSVGGDGTFCEVITGLMLRSDSAYKTVPVALVPAGSGNSQANDMEIMDYMNAIERIVSGRLRKMDIGKVSFTLDDKLETRYSHNLVGWGLGVDSNLLAEKMRFLGPLRYDLGALMSIIRGRVRKARCYIDGHLIDSAFVLLLIQNTKTAPVIVF